MPFQCAVPDRGAESQQIPWRARKVTGLPSAVRRSRSLQHPFPKGREALQMDDARYVTGSQFVIDAGLLSR
jgi:hypothetical protein